MQNILEISSSGRRADSLTRTLTRDIVQALQQKLPATVVHRDLGAGISLIDERWIEANFTPDDERSSAARSALEESDMLVAELKAADTLVIGAPMYNFGIPAALKAWIDQIARARVTFRYTENGPEGLLYDKRAFVVIATGGVSPGSAVDFSTPYLRHALQFIGITDVHIITAAQAGRTTADVLDDARQQISNSIHLGGAYQAA